MNNMLDSLIDPEKVDESRLEALMEKWSLCDGWWNAYLKGQAARDDCPDPIIRHMAPVPQAMALYLAHCGHYTEYAQNHALTGALVALYSAVETSFPTEAAALQEYASAIEAAMQARYRNAAEPVFLTLDPDSADYGKIVEKFKPGDLPRMYKDLFENEEQIIFLYRLLKAATGQSASESLKRFGDGSLQKRKAVEELKAVMSVDFMQDLLSTAYRDDLCKAVRHNDYQVDDSGDIYAVAPRRLLMTAEEFQKTYSTLLDLFKATNNLVAAASAAKDLKYRHRWGYIFSSITLEDGVLNLDLYQLWPFFNLERSIHEMSIIHMIYDEREQHITLELAEPLAVLGVDIHEEDTAKAVRALEQGSELLVCIWPMGLALEAGAETVRYYEDDFQLVFETPSFVATVSSCDLL